MRKILLAAAFTLFAAVSVFAQTKTTLKKIIELKMPKTKEDDMPGTRGAGIAWNRANKLYYAVFAGNSEYPLAVFDQKGSRKSDDDLTAKMDTRGIWYNPATKKVCGNAYNDGGWFSYQFDQKGIPKDVTVISAGMNQPDAQCVGAYNSITRQVIFLKGSRIYFYNDRQKLLDSMIIHFGQKKADGPAGDEDADVTPEDYNATPVFTGIAGQELAFINTMTKEIELYNIKTGYKIRAISLPDSASVEQNFNFSYANGMYWLFDIEERTWIGYR